MGRGRTGFTNQSNKKITKTHMADDKNNVTWLTGLEEKSKKPLNVVITQEQLNAFRQMNPRDIANILVNS